MRINDPIITLVNHPLPINSTKIEEFTLYHYDHDAFYCIDGFPRNGNPCVIILSNPKVNEGSFAGIKPTVIAFQKIPFGFN